MRWYFEVWNEPNLTAFWTGTQQDYFTLYRYTAETIKRVDATRIIMSVASLVQGYSFWTCSDIFAENYFTSETFHGGFGLLTLQAIAKPVYRAFNCCITSARNVFPSKAFTAPLTCGRYETVGASRC